MPYDGIRKTYLPNGGFAEAYNTEFGPRMQTWNDAFPNEYYTWQIYYTRISSLEPDCPPVGYPGPLGGHSWAHGWYTERTVQDSSKQNGFYYSPFMGNGFHGYDPQGGMEMVAALAEAAEEGMSSMPITNFSSFGDVVNNDEVYTITEEANAGIYKTLELPIGVQSVSFKYRFTSPGDGDFLSVHWSTNDAAFIGLDLPLSRSDYVDGIVSLTEYAGETNTLTFKLVSRNDANAVLSISNIVMEVSSDPDGDGLDTDTETTLGTDPLNADTDGDGITDGDEVNVEHTDSLNPDTDGDSIGDGEERRSGTSPTNAWDKLVITEIKVSDAKPTIKWKSVTGKNYRVNCWTNLSGEAFSTVASTVPATAPTNTFTDTATTNKVMFYWIQLEEQ